ncbi:MAG: Crp/Fnr family transcriptional regulator [Spirochaetes bacterium]|nr:Crp/Fnr family transcriptional regulator [Spirochaetota bacterium]MBU1079230.1 Crp/Fnr family transcriptional regulator [Spirochaetota bacterium]
MANENVIQFESGDTVFKEGELGDRMYILLAGAVELKKKVDRGETVLKTVDAPNEFFGEMALIDDRPRSASAVAVKRTNVLAVDGPTFETMILTNGKFALKIIKVLSERIRRSNDQVSDLIETMPRERVARSMVDFAVRNGERIHDGSVKVNLEAMKAWINGHIGTPADEIESTVYRFLKMESIAWAATSAKTKECVVLPPAFIEANDRRTKP